MSLHQNNNLARVQILWITHISHLYTLDTRLGNIDEDIKEKRMSGIWEVKYE